MTKTLILASSLALFNVKHKAQEGPVQTCVWPHVCENVVFVPPCPKGTHCEDMAITTPCAWPRVCAKTAELRPVETCQWPHVCAKS